MVAMISLRQTIREHLFSLRRLLGPLYNQRNAVSPFINIGLGTAEYIAGIMPLRQKLG